MANNAGTQKGWAIVGPSVTGEGGVEPIEPHPVDEDVAREGGRSKRSGPSRSRRQAKHAGQGDTGPESAPTAEGSTRIDLTAADFERQYAEQSGVTVEWLREQGRVIRPCDCGEAICQKWQSISRELAKELPWIPLDLGWVCRGCAGWIDPDEPRQFEVIVSPVGHGEAPMTAGAEVFRYGVYHQRCALAGILR